MTMMTPEQLKGLCETRGYRSRERRGEVQMKVCLFCGNPRWNLELSATKGVYHCWACRESGPLSSFLATHLGRGDVDMEVDLDADRPGRRDEGVPDHLRLRPAHLVGAWEIDSSRRYLQKRGIDATDARRYELQVVRARNHHLAGRLVFPVREYFSRRHLGYVTRSYTGGTPKYQTVTDERPLPVAGYRQIDEPLVVLSEGLFDAIRVHQAGFSAACLLGSTNPTLDGWAERVGRSIGTVVIALDGDATDEAHELKWLVRPMVQRARVLDLPDGRDPADFEPGVIRELVTNVEQTL